MELTSCRALTLEILLPSGFWEEASQGKPGVKGGVSIDLLSEADDLLASHVHGFARGLFLMFAIIRSEDMLDVAGGLEGTSRLSKSFLF